MKSLKSKVFASLAMLLVAAIMMTSASFAWYTLSTQGHAEKIEVQMTAQNTVEIAADSTTPSEVALNDVTNKGQKAWGSRVAYTSTNLVQLADWENGKGIVAPEYNDDLRLGDLVDATISETPSNQYGTTEAKPVIIKDNKQKACAAVYDFYLRTNATPSEAGQARKFKITDDGSTWTDYDDIAESLTVEFALAGNEDISLGQWTKSSHGESAAIIVPTFKETNADTGYGADEYWISHVKMYVYMDGAHVHASDIESGDTMAKFVGKLKVDLQ